MSLERERHFLTLLDFLHAVVFLVMILYNDVAGYHMNLHRRESLKSRNFYIFQNIFNVLLLFFCQKFRSGIHNVTVFISTTNAKGNSDFGKTSMFPSNK